MRVLVTTQPAPSHLGPMLPYLRALADAGHEILVACAHSFTPEVERHGLRVTACGLDWLETRWAETFPEAVGLDGMGQLLFTLRELFGGVAADAFAAELPAVIERWRPDIVLWDGTEFGTHVAAERAGVPHLPIMLGVRLGPAALSRLMGDVLARRRAAHGLSQDERCEALFRHACVSLLPPEWLPPANTGPLPGERFFHPVPTYRPERAEPERPLVYLSLGTVFYATGGVMEALVAALGAGDWDLLAAIGRSRDPAEFGPQPPNVRLVPFAPQRDVLASCALAVHHGGFSSTMECLAAGVPQLVVPLTADQSVHAEAVDRLGLGAVLRHALGEGPPGLSYVDPARIDPAAVLAQARALVADQAAAGRVSAFRTAMDALPREQALVTFVEQVATSA